MKTSHLTQSQTIAEEAPGEPAPEPPLSQNNGTTCSLGSIHLAGEEAESVPGYSSKNQG